MVYSLIFFLQLLILFLLSRILIRELSGLFYRVTKSRKWTVYLLAIIFLPGTFIHEVAHFLVALGLLVPVGQIELLPKIDKNDQVKLGSLSVGKTDPIRKTLIGIAPFILGTTIILTSLYWTTTNNLTENPLVLVLIGYLVFQIANTMFASKKDLEDAWKLIVIFMALYAILYFLGLRLPSINPNTLFSNELIELVKKANIFLLVPLALDFVIIIFLKSLQYLTL